MCIRDSLTEREQNLRWKEHFEEVLNQPKPLSTANFGDTVMADSLEVYEGHISFEEVQRAVSSLTNNKAPGVDEMSAEMVKHGKETVAEQLVELFKLYQHDMAGFGGPSRLEERSDYQTAKEKEVSRTATIGEESHYFLHPAKSSAECC